MEADRGEDLGVVRDKVHIYDYEEDKHTAGHRGRGFALTSGREVKNLLRIATDREKALIPEKVLEEELTLEVIHAERGVCLRTVMPLSRRYAARRH